MVTAHRVIVRGGPVPTNAVETIRDFDNRGSQITLISDALGQRYRLRVSAAALRSVEHRGGLDAFLLKSRDNDLSMRARLLKRQIAKKVAEAAA